MILHPGILALLIGSSVTLALLTLAAAIGLSIARQWEWESSSARQVKLERRTYLISTLAAFSLGVQALSTILFVYTADDLHRLFIGAMCATGSLNANPVGWYALLSKLALFFLSGFWLKLNGVDQYSPSYPLVRLKYVLLLLLLPCIVVDYWLQLNYFLGLQPDIITSCCGSLFASSSNRTIASLTGFPAKPILFLFIAASALHLLLLIWSLYSRKRLLRIVLSLSSATYLFVALITVISVISPSIYELPTHLCPFDMLQREYHFIGYPLYIFLFSSVFFGIVPGLFFPLNHYPDMVTILDRMARKWVGISLLHFFCFTVLATAIVFYSRLNLFS